MAHRIIQQPNGLYAIWSTSVDDFIATDCTLDCTPERLVEEFVEDKWRETMQGVLRIASMLGTGGKSYAEFMATWAEALAKEVLASVPKRYGAEEAERIAALLEAAA